MNHCALKVLSCWNGPKRDLETNTCGRPKRWCFATRGQEHQNGPSLSSLLPGGHCSNPNLSRQFTAQSDHQHLPPNSLWLPPVAQSISTPPASRSAGLREKRGVGCEITGVAGALGAVIESLEIFHAIMSAKRILIWFHSIGLQWRSSWQSLKWLNTLRTKSSRHTWQPY